MMIRKNIIRRMKKISLMWTTPILLVALSSSAIAVTCQYDKLRRLSRTEYPDGTIIEYTYDSSGNRISKTVNLLDSDGDGLSDNLENLGCTDSNDADTDNDGLMDGVEDADHNGVAEYGETDPCNIDSDNDSLQDGTELGLTLADIGDDTDTSIFQPDLDPSTTTDPLNNDTDGDGQLDGEEDSNHNGRVDPGESNPDASQDSSIITPILYLLLR